MEERDLIITISGKAASGKSHLAYMIKEYLRDQGFVVKFDIDDNFKTEREFDKIVKKNFNQAIHSIKNTRIITINQKQISREKKTT